jgi:hypothetical protein
VAQGIERILSLFDHSSNPSEHLNMLVRRLHHGHFFRAK